jgi:hypothetical protein
VSEHAIWHVCLDDMAQWHVKIHWCKKTRFWMFRSIPLSTLKIVESWLVTLVFISPVWCFHIGIPWQTCKVSTFHPHTCLNLQTFWIFTHSARTSIPKTFSVLLFVFCLCPGLSRVPCVPRSSEQLFPSWYETLVCSNCDSCVWIPWIYTSEARTRHVNVAWIHGNSNLSCWCTTCLVYHDTISETSLVSSDTYFVRDIPQCGL